MLVENSFRSQERRRTFYNDKCCTYRKVEIISVTTHISSRDWSKKRRRIKTIQDKSKKKENIIQTP